MDLEILERIQYNFPIEEKPFKSISRELGIGKEELIEKIKKYRAEGYVRKISPKLASSEIGYKASTLVAVKVPKEGVEKTAEIVNGYEGVSHNYERAHEYNLWFTLHAESEDELHKTIGEIRKRINPTDLLNLPKQKQFKLEVEFKPLKEVGAK